MINDYDYELFSFFSYSMDEEGDLIPDIFELPNLISPRPECVKPELPESDRVVDEGEET